MLIFFRAKEIKTNAFLPGTGRAPRCSGARCSLSRRAASMCSQSIARSASTPSTDSETDYSFETTLDRYIVFQLRKFCKETGTIEIGDRRKRHGG